MAKHLKIREDTVQRIWNKAGQNLIEWSATWRAMALISSAYLNRPKHAAVSCMDERLLPMSPGRSERHGCEYYRHEVFRCQSSREPML